MKAMLPKRALSLAIIATNLDIRSTNAPKFRPNKRVTCSLINKINFNNPNMKLHSFIIRIIMVLMIDREVILEINGTLALVEAAVAEVVVDAIHDHWIK